MRAYVRAQGRIAAELDHVPQPLLALNEQGLAGYILTARPLWPALGVKRIGRHTPAARLISLPSFPKMARDEQRDGASELRFRRLGVQSQRLVERLKRLGRNAPVLQASGRG